MRYIWCIYIICTMHISNHLILRQWISRPSTSESLVSTSSEEGTARWRVPLSQSLRSGRQATMRRPDCRMTQGKDCCDFTVLLCTGRKNSTVWNYGKEVCQCIPNIVIFKYEICMKHVWNMYEICMAYVQFTPQHKHERFVTLWRFEGNDSFISAKASDGFAESAP